MKINFIVSILSLLGVFGLFGFLVSVEKKVSRLRDFHSKTRGRLLHYEIMNKKDLTSWVAALKNVAKKQAKTDEKVDSLINKKTKPPKKQTKK